ncbi:MAG: 5-methyltetrahydropteroyltriglutamate--homocysteine S-methyltransferase [Treponema sp.]|nr:5-methyltetrahydropteroyltriglutamate--homocysteine S-methyltransferase [Treponema sp.]
MKTSIIGFPRIGEKRELKFACEKYFKGTISSDELQKVASDIRSFGWKKQNENGIDFIPSNDFSFYDNMLDTAVMLGCIPERYKNLNLSELDTYFAMAHGYQGEKGDVKALAMKKWFNTNYHYIVPEIDAKTKFSCDIEKSKPVVEFLEAKKEGFDTVPYLIGPYTFLHLVHYFDNKNSHDFISEAIAIYVKIIKSLCEKGAEWISLAEPALVFDMDNREVAYFKSFYSEFLYEIRSVCGIKILLQTYFGDIRNVYKEVYSLGFDAIGLDFYEGKETAKIVNDSFPQNTKLFAGIVCGKNIWRNDYSKTQNTINEIAKKISLENIVINTSCSLLHVPYTTKNETKLDSEKVKYLSFAEEKLEEIRNLSDLFNGNIDGKNSLENNQKLFATQRTIPNQEVKNKLLNLKESDFERLPSFAEREAIQKKEFALPLFPTTTIGSFPQTADVRANRAAFKKGSISLDEYKKFNKEKIAQCIKLQEELGLDVLVHGEFERNDMVEYFGDHLCGYIFTENGWVQSYGTRCVKPPVIWGDVSRKESITVEWSTFAQSCTKKPVKGMLTGPVTILNWSFPREDLSLKDKVYQIALAMKDEVLDLEKNGIRIIQIDEAALREKLPLRKTDWHSCYLDWAIPSFRILHAHVKPQTQIHTHMCYSEFGDIIKDIDNMDADVITFEASRSDLSILDDLNKASFRTEVGPGVYDIHSPRVPSVEEIKSALEKMVKKIDTLKLWVNPDCGLKTRGDVETKAALQNLVEATVEIRKEYIKK